MHAIKGGWAGQAFAVAANNESGGRKSRIRRSKEERKTMVESFINKYQKSNDGIFPSFYTVREIVREIIQENRALAPPKVSLKENDHSGFFEHHPLGSNSMEPQTDLSVPNRPHIINGISKMAEKDEGSGNGSILLVNDEQNINNNEIVDKNEEFRKRIYMESVVMEIQDDFVNEKDDKKLPYSTVKLDGEFSDEKLEIHILDPSLESSKHSTASNVLDATDLESKDSSSHENKANSSTEPLTSQNSIAVERKSIDQENSTLLKGSNPTLDRINLETWEGTSKNSTQPETNPLLALVKTFISSFVKFWTE